MEAALVTPLVMLLVFGMVDFSLMMRDYISVTASVRAGTRTASAAAGAGPGTCITGVDAPTCTGPGSPALAQAAADSMQKSLTGLPGNTVNYVLIYKANDKGYPGAAGATTMPATCSGYTDCVQFTWNTAANSGAGGFRYASGAWNSTTINACVNEADSVGIYLNVTHKWVTGLFGSTFNLDDKSVMRFEPLSTETCKSTSPAHHP